MKFIFTINLAFFDQATGVNTKILILLLLKDFYWIVNEVILNYFKFNVLYVRYLWFNRTNYYKMYIQF